MMHIIGAIILAVVISVLTSRINQYIDWFTEQRKKDTIEPAEQGGRD